MTLTDGSVWSGQWPESEAPRGQYIYAVDSFSQWMDTDFYTHPWCRPMAELLSNQRTLLKLALPSLTTLISSAWDIETNQERKAIFKLLQLFARLSIAFGQSSTSPKASVLDWRQYILDGLKITPDGNSHTVSKQVAILSKMSKQVPGAKPAVNPPQRNQRFNKNWSQGQRGFRQSGTPRQNTPRNVKCFKCGKLGHVRRNCRAPEKGGQGSK